MATVGLTLYAVLGSSSQSTRVTPSQPAATFASQIDIGDVTELSGSGSTDSYGAMLGAELAVNQANLSGGVDGSTIRLVVADSQTNSRAALQAATTLDQQNPLLALTGLTVSSDALSIRSYSESHGVPFVVAAAASAALTSSGSNWTVGVRPDSVQQGVAAAKYVSEAVPNAKIALMSEDAQEQNEMAAGVRWYAHAFKNVSLAFDQTFTSAAFRGQQLPRP
jgi:branched-chain amino acid transport system substrate-binding protein